MNNSQPKNKKSSEITLAQAFDFTPDDLIANRLGKVTRRQYAVLRKRFWFRSRYIFAIFAGMLAALFLPYLLIVLADPFDKTHEYTLLKSQPAMLYITLVTSLVGVGAVYAVGKFFYHLWHDQFPPKVGVIEGVVTLEAALRFWIYVGTKGFQVSQDQFQAFKSDQPYAVYYTLRTHTILSVEWLNTDPFE